MAMLKAKDRQSLLDMQLIASGTLEGIMEVCRTNGLALTDELSDGQELTFGEAGELRTARIYSFRGISPATAIQPEEEVLMPSGIGYMAIQIDFIVS